MIQYTKDFYPEYHMSFKPHLMRGQIVVANDLGYGVAIISSLIHANRHKNIIKEAREIADVWNGYAKRYQNREPFSGSEVV